MAAKSDIEWTQATWNPIAGCSIVSAGCRECYAMRRVAPRLANNRATPHYAGTVEPSKAGYVWTGKIGIASDKVFLAPLRTRKPTTFFVNSVSDLFHEGVPDEVIDRIFAIMALCPQHTFQVLTKRPERMRAYITNGGPTLQQLALIPHPSRYMMTANTDWPLPNVWLGTSAEDQKTADARIPHLLATPAAIRFLSAEPLLGAIDLTALPAFYPAHIDVGYRIDALTGTYLDSDGLRLVSSAPRLDWVIVGGESGRNARPMHPHWARQIRDQCAAARGAEAEGRQGSKDSGVPFFFKQWGEWLPVNQMTDAECDRLYKPAPERDPDATRRCNVAVAVLHRDGQQFSIAAPNVFLAGAGAMCIYAVGKKAAGRLLDGVEHDGMPEAQGNG